MHIDHRSSITVALLNSLIILTLSACSWVQLEHAQAAAQTQAVLPTAQPSLAPALLDPGPTPAPPACTARTGRIQEADLATDRLPEPLHYRIYLPPCYTSSGGPGYPVLYLIHGLLLDDSQWDRIGADEAADRLIASGEAPAFIIVMPYDRRAVEPSQDAFGEAVALDLVPWIDAHYHTHADRQFRAVGGLSRGAGWAIHLGFSHWDVFGSVGAHSLALFFEDTPQMSTWIKNIPANLMPRFYLDIGRGDGELEGVSEFEAYLTQADVPHQWRLNNGLHEEKYWSAHVAQYLRWYSAVWQ